MRVSVAGHSNVTCGAGSLACGARGPCVPAAARCDGARDCPRGEDERACACPPDTFRCAADPQCLTTVNIASTYYFRSIPTIKSMQFAFID